MIPFKSLAVAGALATLFFHHPATAQTASPPYGPPITLEQAKKAVSAAETVAAAGGWPVVIAVLDSSGQVVMILRRDDAQHSSVELAQGKARTALMFKRQTKVLDDAIAGGGAGLRFLALKDIVPLEGGFPIVIEGKIVGAVGISGALSAQNSQVGQAALDAVQ